VAWQPAAPLERAYSPAGVTAAIGSPASLEEGEKGRAQIVLCAIAPLAAKAGEEPAESTTSGFGGSAFVDWLSLSCDGGGPSDRQLDEVAVGFTNRQIDDLALMRPSWLRDPAPCSNPQSPRNLNRDSQPPPAYQSSETSIVRQDPLWSVWLDCGITVSEAQLERFRQPQAARHLQAGDRLSHDLRLFAPHLPSAD
jgi:hypothetical protein